jgi:hypothetical protein
MRRADDRELDITLSGVGSDDLILDHDPQRVGGLVVGALLEHRRLGPRQVHQQPKHLDHVRWSNAALLEVNDVPILQGNLERF